MTQAQAQAQAQAQGAGEPERPPDRPTRPAGGQPGPPVLDESAELHPEIARRVNDARFVARGAQAVVFHGRWASPDRFQGVEVAVKVYPEGAERRDDEIWEWWRENDNLHIVPLMFAGRFGGRDYEIARWQPGGSLRQFEGTPLSAFHLSALLRQLAAAMRLCQDPPGFDGRSIIHRDIKPDNVFVTTPDPARLLHSRTEPIQVCVADFGSARITAYNETTAAANEVGVTDAYAAPEVSKGDASTASDWFSIGMTLLHLACGEYPFRGLFGQDDDGFSLRRYLRHEENFPIDVRHIEAYQARTERLDDRWGRLFAELLAFDPRHRWRLSDVQQWLRGEDPPIRRAAAHNFSGPPQTPYGPPPPEATEPETAGELFAFADLMVASPARMADAMRAYWYPHAGDLVSSARLTALADWAAGFDQTMGPRLQALAGVWPPDRAVARAIVILNPNGGPVFFGTRLDGQDRDRRWLGLINLAATAAAGERDANAEPPAALDAVIRLWDAEGLRELTTLRGCEQLADIHQYWVHLMRTAQRGLETVPRDPDGPDFERLEERLLAMTLRASADPDYVRSLSRTAQSARSGIWTSRNRRVGWFRALQRSTRDPYTGEVLPEAPAYHALMIVTSPLLDDPENRIEPRTYATARAEMQRLVAEVDAEIAAGKPARGSSGAWLARPPEEHRRRRLVAVAAAVAYLWLVTTATVGVGTQTTWQEAWLTAGLLLVLGAWLPIALRLRRGRVRRALQGGWLGGVVGLLVAAGLGGATGFAVGPDAAWPAFWVGWVALVVVGTIWGAAE